MSRKIRTAIVGVGNMGSGHIKWLTDSSVPELQLVAIADTDPARLGRGFPGVAEFGSTEALLASGLAEAVIVATPHYDHTTVGIQALRAGVHVLVEKPISVHRADCERLIAAHTNPKQVFAAVFNQRTDPYFKNIRELVQTGELGEIRRVNWIITNWFRTEAYYASGGWRATWAGEGGGVLLNQCPHNLDLLQWIVGMPAKVQARCGFGRYHAIEVEDDVTATFEFANGATGVFITSTGEHPGTNRLEIVGERGRVVYENDKISFDRNPRGMTEFSRTCPQSFGTMNCWQVNIPAPNHGDRHVGILKNFAGAILRGETLIAHASEGIHSVELANAMLLSAWTGTEVSLPIDGARYEALLQEKIAASRDAAEAKKKNAITRVADDFASSFAR